MNQKAYKTKAQKVGFAEMCDEFAVDAGITKSASRKLVRIFEKTLIKNIILGKDIDCFQNLGTLEFRFSKSKTRQTHEKTRLFIAKVQKRNFEDTKAITYIPNRVYLNLGFPKPFLKNLLKNTNLNESLNELEFIEIRKTKTKSPKNPSAYFKEYKARLKLEQQNQSETSETFNSDYLGYNKNDQSYQEDMSKNL